MFEEVRWESIDAFRGREASAILITGIGDFDQCECRRWAYVGCSRARWLLAMVLPSTAQDSIAGRARGFGEMLAARDGDSQLAVRLGPSVAAQRLRDIFGHSTVARGHSKRVWKRRLRGLSQIRSSVQE